MASNDYEKAERRIWAWNATVMQIIRFIATLVVWGGIITGIWIPLAKTIADNPVSAIWWIPLGFLLSGFAAAIGMFVNEIVIGIVIGIPMFLFTWITLRIARLFSPKP